MSVSRLSRKKWQAFMKRALERDRSVRGYLPCVYVKPRKGRCSALKTELAVGGSTSALLRSVSSTSKLDVSVGLLTSGMYGAVLSRMLSQSIPANHG